MRADDPARLQRIAGEQHQAHEHAAVDGSLDEAAVPMPPAHGEGRRHVAQGVDHQAGDGEDDGPQPGLRERGTRDPQNELRDPSIGLGPLG